MFKKLILAAMAAFVITLPNTASALDFSQLSKEVREIQRIMRDGDSIMRSTGRIMKNVRSGALVGEQNNSSCRAHTKYARDENGDLVVVRERVNCSDTSRQPGWGSRPF